MWDRDAHGHGTHASNRKARAFSKETKRDVDGALKRLMVARLHAVAQAAVLARGMRPRYDGVELDPYGRVAVHEVRAGGYTKTTNEYRVRAQSGRVSHAFLRSRGLGTAPREWPRGRVVHHYGAT